MKIILVHNRYKLPGGEDVVFEQELQLLLRCGHDVQTYCRSNWEVDSYSGVKQLALAQRMIWASDTYRDFSDLLCRQKPDLVHVHNVWYMISPSIYVSCFQAGVPVVQTVHNYRLLCPSGQFFRDGKTCEECVDHGLQRSVLHACYNGSRPATAALALALAVHRLMRTWSTTIDTYITLSQFSRSKILKAGIPAKSVFVKPNFLYPDPGPATDERRYALFIGRLTGNRVSTILKAWTQLNHGLELLIIGDGPEASGLQEEAAFHRLSTVRFQGHQSREEVITCLRRAAFLIFSSQWYENFPMTIIEAFACGVPVICSRMGAMQEIVEDGRTGLHFIPGNADDLAAKVDWAWNHPERMQEMGREARKEYESKYTAEKNYPLLMKIYQHAIAGRSSKLVPDQELAEPESSSRLHWS
jgi:glycosyltransferase involved in cell wall biosynthesis